MTTTLAMPLAGPLPVLADPALSIDPVVSVEALPDGTFTVTTADGHQAPGRVTRSGAALRLRVGADPRPSALLDPSYDEVPVPVAPDGAGITGAGFAWHPQEGGLRLDAVREAHVGMSRGTAGTTGRVMDRDGAPHGWVVCVALAPDAAVYGGGECFQGPDLRGRVRRCVNREVHGAAGFDESYLTVPLVWSDAGWGLFAHSGGPVRVDAGSTHTSTVAVEIAGDELDVFAYQGDAAAVLRAHHRVTGLPGRFPEWGLGIWTSRCSYLTADEVDDVLDGYAAADCPVDVVHVDAWQAGNVMSDLSTAWTVNRDRWPAGWAGRVRERGVRLSLWHNPYLREGTVAGDEAVARGLVLRDAAGALVETPDLPGRLLVDFTSPEARNWWRAQVGTLVAEGASAVKPDFAEEVPPQARCADGRDGWQVRNEYALLYQRESHAALRAALGDDAVALFCRSGTAGAQRYPCHWVGDTPATWDGMVAALRACLSLSLSGFAFVAADVGGFWTPESHAWVSAACEAGDPTLAEADVEPELFARWAQWGALSPVMRFHGTGRREPWAYPDPYGAAAVAACRVRQALRRYLATVAAEASADGVPMMRPMPLAFPADRAARDAVLQYLLGPDLLVAPVLEPGGRVRVWAPAAGWHGLAGAPALTAGWNELVLPLDAVPAWVRPGAEGVYA